MKRYEAEKEAIEKGDKGVLSEIKEAFGLDKTLEAIEFRINQIIDYLKEKENG